MASSTVLGDEFENTEDDAVKRCRKCGVLVRALPGSKLLKQHIKSRPHKLASREEPAVQQAERAPARERLQTSWGEQLANLCSLAERTGNDYVYTAAAYRECFGTGVRPCLCPELVAQPKKRFPNPRVPFLTRQSGQLPLGTPDNLDTALKLYGNQTGGRLPNVDVSERNIKVASCNEARHVLLEACDSGKNFWAAFASNHIQHPAWWPKNAINPVTSCGEGPDSVPNYDQVIVGFGLTGIGWHVDAFEGRLVNTYLTIARGFKRAGTLFDKNQGHNDFRAERTKIQFPTDTLPDPDVVDKIHQLGGFVFDMCAMDDENPLCLFIPKGWWHWLLGSPGWHVVFGGSHFGL